jgi:predicted RNase H-like nuclease (RuvC/YqgF family)
MSDGKGCQCHAHCEHECCCDADWTTKEVYDLRAENARLTADLDEKTAERDAANARLAVSMEAHQITISGTVASLLHMITLTREAAGCRDGDNLPAFVGNMKTMINAIESMGYEWRWTKSIDADGEQVGAWVMRDAAEADANNERFRRGDGE